MNDILISLIFSIYNCEKILNKCLKSVIAQTYLNLEIILVDDGSSRRCPYLCCSQKEWRGGRVRNAVKNGLILLLSGLVAQYQQKISFQNSLRMVKMTCW